MGKVEASMSPEERILLAAIDCINEEGFAGATIRRIAERAEVNQAAISYYYRGKDKLLELALETTLKNAFDLADFADSADFAPKERLSHILEGLIAGSLRYPGIARAHFYAPLMRGDYKVPAIKRLNQFMTELAADLAERYRKLNQEVPDLAKPLVAIAASTILYASTMPDAFSNLNLRNPVERRDYIKRIVTQLLP